MLLSDVHDLILSRSFIAPSNDGLGLFARVPLKPNQAISEYGGPRLPVRMHIKGQFVLQVSRTSHSMVGHIHS